VTAVQGMAERQGAAPCLGGQAEPHGFLIRPRDDAEPGVERTRIEQAQVNGAARGRGVVQKVPFPGNTGNR
jgi:hypothetical protein